VTPAVAGRLAALGARQRRASVIRSVRVEPALDGASGHVQGLAARRGLDGLEVEAVNRPRADQRFDFGGDFTGERFFEPPFLATSVSEAAWAASSSASDHRSHACQYASMSLRNCWPASTC
jgi:hypothetical protein